MDEGNVMTSVCAIACVCGGRFRISVREGLPNYCEKNFKKHSYLDRVEGKTRLGRPIAYYPYVSIGLCLIGIVWVVQLYKSNSMFHFTMIKFSFCLKFFTLTNWEGHYITHNSASCVYNLKVVDTLCTMWTW